MILSKIKIGILFLAVMMFTLFAFKPNDSNNSNIFTNMKSQPEELGKVTWERDFNKGLAQSKEENKPMFLLFQEVPGCSTCRNYGNNVLSHPQIVEAIETLFVPVAVFNNKKGADARVLKMFKEPSWNNPVVRIIDGEKNNLVKRVSGNYSKLGIVHAMVFALQKEEMEIPMYLKLLKQSLEAETTGTETATFSMFCFWTGEKKLGNVNGVLETQPGFMNGREVVKVKYNPIVVSYEELLTQAKNASCASHVYTEDQIQTEQAKKIVGNNSTSKKSKFRMDKEPKYYLSKSVYRFIPMTQIQATKVNVKIGSGQSPDEFLSPRQLELLDFIQKNPKGKWKSAINVELQKAWGRIEKARV